MSGILRRALVPRPGRMPTAREASPSKGAEENDEIERNLHHRVARVCRGECRHAGLQGDRGQGHRRRRSVRPPAAGTARNLIAYYLHGKVRCVTCNDIEKTAREAVEASFAEELEAGRIEWRSVNYEEPGNEHFATDFELAAPCVVLSTIETASRPPGGACRKSGNSSATSPRFRSFIEENIREQLSGVRGRPQPRGRLAAVAAL